MTILISIMKNIFYFIIISILFSCDCSKKEESATSETTTVYYFIRHAEKDRSDPNNKEPELTEAGIQRAKKWASIFETVHLDQIYSTDYLRTQQTVMYIATNQNVAVRSYDPKELYSENFKDLTAGEIVLIVGHSNTTPAFVNAVIGEENYPQIDDSNNGNLYIVTLNESGKSVQLLTINK